MTQYAIRVSTADYGSFTKIEDMRFDNIRDAESQCQAVIQHVIDTFYEEKLKKWLREVGGNAQQARRMKDDFELDLADEFEVIEIEDENEVSTKYDDLSTREIDALENYNYR